MTLPSEDTLIGALRKIFGFTAFREGQREAIADLLEHGGVLCILPTGHGKSLLYQLPAALLEGMTLVISPLLALMRDQLQQLNSRFRIPAASINSDQSDEENDRAIRSARAGELKILFVSPERLDNLETFRFLTELPIELIVVDEDHCISTWGHDFRPSYRQIVRAVRELEMRRPSLRLLGLTATADDRTERDIAQQLSTADGRILRIHRRSMDRPNIALSVVPANGAAEKLEFVRSFVGERRDETGVIYCATRENVEVVSEYLSQQGIRCAAYHAGADPETKRALQEEFFAGDVRLIAATNALGMGVDKTDIRFIVHFDVPGSITAYYQEIGRAGRDGLPAVGFLVFDPLDQKVQQYFITSAQPSTEDFSRVLAVIPVASENAQRPQLQSIKAQSGLHPTLVTVILAELSEQGFIEKQLDGRKQVYVRTVIDSDPDLSRYERQFQVRTRELAAMMSYGRGEPECYMQYLRRALGDSDPERCGRCSRCRGEVFSLPGAERAEAWLADRPTPIAKASMPIMEEGISAIDGSLRSPLFVDFMKRRTDATWKPSDVFLTTILRAVDRLQEKHRLVSMIVLPSRTWIGRQEVAAAIGAHLGIEPEFDVFLWQELPSHRQGELLNNDQRRENVKGKMGIKNGLRTSNGTVLLFDDYVGCGATLKEAVTVLRKQAQFRSPIVPLTVARVRWRLGRAGMV